MALFSPTSLRHPVVQAPMGGGPSTPALAAAVSGAGGLGFLAAGYRSVPEVAADLAAVRALLPAGAPFGVNVFAPPGHGGGVDDVGRYAEALRREADLSGVALGTPRWDDDRYDDKLDLLAAEQVPVVSFTFGCPPAADVARLQEAGSAVWVTVTTAQEARSACGAGVDGLVVQGVEAGGHRGAFDDASAGDVGLLALLQLVRAAVGEQPPLVATGGIATGRAVAAVLAAGAAAAQLGTAFLLCPEAGTSPAHRDRVGHGRETTALTRAFTGRAARGIVNRFLRDHSAGAPSAYPEVHHLTAPLRAAARSRGDADGFHLWAGQAYPLAAAVPAADVVARVSDDARAALSAAAGRFGSPAEGPAATVRRVPSPSPYAPVIGFSSAVRAGDLVVVSGTTAVDESGELVGGDDAYAQTTEALRKVRLALEAAGTDLAHVVQTRMHLRDAADWEGVGRAHGEAFAGARPAATMVVTGLLDPRMLVEVEAVAYVGGSAGG